MADPPSAEVLAERIQALRELVYAHAKTIETEGKRTDTLAEGQTRHEEQLNGEDGMRKQLAAIRSRMDDMVKSNNRLAWAMAAAALAFAADVVRGVLG